MVRIIVKGTITIDCDANANKGNKNLVLNINAPFTNCFLKINGVKIGNAEDLSYVKISQRLAKW